MQSILEQLGVNEESVGKMGFTIDKKWVKIFPKDEPEKIVRFRRNSKNGVLLESLLNNVGQGVNQEVAAYAMDKLIPVPKLSSVKEQKAWMKNSMMDEVSAEIGEGSRALSMLTNGRVYIEMGPKGVRFVVPPDLENGMKNLMEMVNPNNNGDDHDKFQPIDVAAINDLFMKCGTKLTAVTTPDNKIDFRGEDIKKIMQFFKSCGGYDVPSSETFF